MALPTLVKSWQFNVNQSITGASANLMTAGMAYAIKTSLCSFALNPWTVKRSSDSVNVSNTDRWTSVSNVVYIQSAQNNPASARSWIILQQPKIHANFEILIDCINTAGNTDCTNIYFSQTGFTGGTISSRPTATDEYQVFDGAVGSTSTIGTQSGSTVTHRLHVMQSTDGECTRIVTASGGTVRGVGFYDRAQSTNTGFTTPAIVLGLGKGTGNHAALFNGADIQQVAQVHTIHETTGAMINTRATLTTEVNNTTAVAALFSGANELSSEYGMFVVGFAVNALDRFGRKGRHGRLVDLWVAQSGAASGDGYPGDGTNQFAQFGSLILPWPGSSTAINLT